MLHRIPEGDDFEHSLHAFCECKPFASSEKGQPIIIHNRLEVAEIAKGLTDFFPSDWNREARENDGT